MIPSVSCYNNGSFCYLPSPWETISGAGGERGEHGTRSADPACLDLSIVLVSIVLSGRAVWGREGKKKKGGKKASTAKSGSKKASTKKEDKKPAAAAKGGKKAAPSDPQAMCPVALDTCTPRRIFDLRRYDSPNRH